MGLLNNIIENISAIHINAFITIKYFFIISAWIIIAIVGFGYTGYLQLKDVEEKTLKPKRKRL